jgi:putative spermidine/putrescine transport system substrate-binding protein
MGKGNGLILPGRQGQWSRRAILKAGASAAGLAAGAALLPRASFAQGADEAPDADLVAKAKQEGTLTFYHTTAIDLTALWTKEFTKKYGIATQNVRGPSYPLWDRWLTEERAGQHVADALQITDNVLIEAAHDEKLIADYTPKSGAGIRDGMKKEGVWYAAFLNAMGYAWNSTRVSEEEDKLLRTAKWEVLTDPRWAGRFATATPASGGSSFSFVYMFLRGKAK